MGFPHTPFLTVIANLTTLSTVSANRWGKIGLRLEYQRKMLSVLVWPMTTVPVMVRPVRLAPSSVRVTT